MNKKAIAILGAIFLLIVGTLTFLIFQRRSETNSTTNNTTNPTPTPTEVGGVVVDPTPIATPTTALSGVTPINLTSDSVVSPILFYQGNGLAYFNTQGQLFQADLDLTTGTPQLTNKRELGVPAKAGVTKVHWPAAGNNYLVELTTASGGTAWAVYVSNKGVYVDVPPQVTSIAWLPDGEQLLYFWLENGKTNLNVSPADMSTWQTVTDMWENDNALAISPDGKVIVYWRTQSQEATNKINLVSPDGKLFRTIVKDGFNVGALWSPDSQKFAFNRKSASGTWQLWVGNVYTGELQNMNIEAKLDQVTWAPDSKVLYAASASTSGDLLYRVDAAAGSQKLVEVATRISPVSMFTSSDGGSLYFKNNLDGGLYFLNVGQLGN